MSADRWRQIEELFHRAADLEPAERDAFLSSACGADRKLREEVGSLLAADADPGSVLEAAVADAAGRLPEGPEDGAALIGKRIGPYSILSLIGQGGMGAVYSAVRDGEFRMEVALKLLKRGTDTEAALGHFRKERQILANLQHPNIARLLDGGSTEDGLPYFAMEYVEGRPLLEYSAALSIRQRLEMFRSVCAAVQYAHQNLIVHRDLKPGNILVTQDGTPKLLDFGIAKLLDPDSAGRDLTLTAVGARLMTPDYASPEQVRGEPISTASDVYSLGVILYELLTGERPYRLETHSREGIERAICREEPRRPSARNGQLDKDLDNIVLMALRKEPARRYASAEQLSEDVRNYLEGRPVRARKDTLGYRSWKFLGRNKLGVAAAALALAGAAAGVVAVNRQARRAEYRFRQVRKLARTVLFDLNPQIENLAGSTKARELLVKTSLEYLNSLTAEAGDDPALQLELAEAYEKIGDVQGNIKSSNLGHPKAALESYDRALAIAGKRAPSLPALELLARTHAKMAAVERWNMGNYAEARRDVTLAAQVADSIPAKTGTPAYFVRADAYGLLGDIELDSHPDRSLEPYRHSLEIAREWVRASPSPESEQFLARAISRWGIVLGATGDVPGALDSSFAALQTIEKLLREEPGNVAWRLRRDYFFYNIGGVYSHPSDFNLGNRQAAEEWLQKAVDDLDRMLAADPDNRLVQEQLKDATADMASVIGESDPSRAERLFRRSLALIGSILEGEPQNPEFLADQGFTRIRLASVSQRLGKQEEGLEELRKGIEMLAGLHHQSPGNFRFGEGLGRALVMMAAYRLKMGDPGGARQDLERSLEVLEGFYRQYPRNLAILRDLAECHKGFGDLAAARGDWKQARIGYQECLDLWERWKQIGTSSVYDRRQRDLAASLVARADREALKTSPHR